MSGCSSQYTTSFKTFELFFVANQFLQAAPAWQGNVWTKQYTPFKSMCRIVLFLKVHPPQQTATLRTPPSRYYTTF
jgi:hypothetical protein